MTGFILRVTEVPVPAGWHWYKTTSSTPRSDTCPRLSSNSSTGRPTKRPATRRSP